MDNERLLENDPQRIIVSIKIKKNELIEILKTHFIFVKGIKTNLQPK